MHNASKFFPARFHSGQGTGQNDFFGRLWTAISGISDLQLEFRERNAQKVFEEV